MVFLRQSKTKLKRKALYFIIKTTNFKKIINLIIIYNNDSIR